jgi:hypothetical protein
MAAHEPGLIGYPGGSPAAFPLSRLVSLQGVPNEMPLDALYDLWRLADTGL